MQALKFRSALFSMVAMTLVASAASAGDRISEVFDPAEFRGQVVYLDFWASWCTPCKASFPWMTTLQHRFGSDGLVVVAVNVDSDSHAAHQFLERAAPGFEVRFDPDGELAEQYGLKGMPSSYILGRNGQVLFSHTGFRESDKAELESQVRQALNTVQVSELSQ